MAREPIDYVETEKFPRDVRAVVNDLADFANVPWIVLPSEANSITGARFEFSDERNVLFLPRGAFATTFPPFAFQVLFRNNGTAESPSWQRGIYKESPVQQTVDPDDLVYASGLLSDDVPVPSTTGWATTGNNDFIWQEIVFDNTNPDNPFSIVDNNIKSSAAGGGTNHWPVEYINTGTSDAPVYEQTKLRIPIAKIQLDSSTKNKPVVKIQYANTVMRLIAVQTVTAKNSGGSSPVDISGMMYTK